MPALVGVPLTSRGVSESFWVVTGTTQSHALSGDLTLAARSTATVVVLMGMHKLAEIVEIYTQLGKLQEPITIIQNGSLPSQKMITGKISNILPLVQVSELGSPAIIVIGPAAALPDQAKTLAHTAVAAPDLRS